MIWLLAIVPALLGILLWAAGERPRMWLGTFATLATAATAVLAVAAADWSGQATWAPGLVLRAQLTPLAWAVAVMVPAVATAVVIFAAAHEAERGLPRLLGLVLVFTGAMELVVVAADLLTLLVGWEVMGACSWALIGHRWRDAHAMPSAAYAFVMTRAGDLGLFLALFACFAAAGSADYAALGQLDGGTQVLAAFGILLAAAAKAGQVPFSPWLFRAMDGPTSVSALLHSSTMVAAGAFLLARLHPWLGSVPGFAAFAIGLGLATALAGGLVAVMQMHAKKLLAGSTSAQLGLMFAAVGAGFPGVAVLHLIAHAAFKAPLFFAAGIAHDQVASFDLRRMALGRAMSLVAGLTALAALALAGVPPLGGAWTKEEIVGALAHLSPWLALMAMIAGGLSAAYAARFALMAYGPGEPEEGDAAQAEVVAHAALAAVTLLLSVLWWPAAHDAMARALGIGLPVGGWLEMTASLLLVGAGLLSGLWLTRHAREHPAADWLGLPNLIDAVVIRPAAVVANWASMIDDAVLDAIPRGATALARSGAQALVYGDDHGIDGMNQRTGQAGHRAGRGAVALIVRLSDASARGAGNLGEAASDLIPSGSGNLMGMAGHDVRRLQTGQSHHYYVVMVTGAAVGIAVLILGA